MELRLLSFNPTGFNPTKAKFIKFLTDSLLINIFFLQEHLQLQANVFKIQNEYKDFNSFILPAYKNNSVISSGRQSGGLGIFWKNSLNNCIKPIVVPNSNRVQAINVNNKIIMFNCYFPCDSQNNDFDVWELLKCIEEINSVIDAYPSHLILMGGDFNCDFSRDTPFVKIVRDFIMNLNLTVA